MTKLVLDDTNSGYNLSKINSNFDKIADVINNDVLSRQNPTGDSNEMEVDLDMNGKRLYNLPKPVLLNEAARLQDIADIAGGGLIPTTATQIQVSPASGITSTNAQAALEELSTKLTTESATRATADTTLNTGITTANANASAALTAASALVIDARVDPAAAINSAKLSHVSSFGGTGPVPIASLLDEFPSGKLWAVAANTGTDQQPNLNAAIINGSGELHLPPGVFQLNSTLQINHNAVKIYGTKGATNFRSTTTTGDIIQIGNGTTNPANVSIYDVVVSSVNARSSGAAVKVANGHNITLSNINLNENMFWGFQFDGGVQQYEYYLNNFEINSGQIGILVGSDGGQVVQDLYVTTGAIAGVGTGVMKKNASGCYYRDVDIISSTGHGWSIWPDTGKTVVACTFDNCYADTGADDGWFISTNGGFVAEMTLTNCWAQGNGGSNNSKSGILVNQGAGQISGVMISVPRASRNAGPGITIGPSSGVEIHDVQMFCNSRASSGTVPGINVLAGVSDWSVRGGRIGYGGLWRTAGQHSYNIFIASGSSDRYIISGVNVNSGYTVATIFDGGSGTNKVISGNIL